MAKLNLHNPELTPAQIAQQRNQRFLALTPLEKWNELLALIQLAVAMNGGKPIKQPQGKGIIIRKIKENSE